MDQGQDNGEMNADAGPILLRVIAGLQRGAEMPLNPGTYLIGSGDDCDIVVTDDLVAETHFDLDVSENALAVRSRDAAVAVGDVLLQPGEEATVAAPFAVALGQSALGVGASGTDWSALPVPDLAAALAAAEEAQSAEGESEGEQSEEAASDDADMLADPDQQDEVSPAESEPQEMLAGDAEDEIDDGESGQAAAGIPAAILAQLEGPWRAAAVGALVLVIGTASAFFVLSGGDDQAAAAQIAALEEAGRPETIRERLNQAGLREVDLKRDHRGAFRLSGYVPDEEARKVMREIFHEAQASFHDHVRQVNDIMRSVEYSLENYKWPSLDFGQHLIANYVGGGVFEIDGYLGPEVDRTDLNRQIVTDAPGVVRLDFSRARLADWRSELDVELERAGLKPWIQTTIVDGGIRVSGEITPKEAEIWREVGQKFVDKTRGWPKLTIAVRAAGPHRIGTSVASSIASAPGITAQAPAPRSRAVQPNGFSIIGVIMPTDGPGRILLDNGSSRAEGEALADGTVLKSVSLNKVIVRKGNKNVEYRVGEEG